ncbi:MAG: VWA domain-containing protein, partial [Blastocatellia bacterium]|nr:VWA domain-containing protein [Blastocatellia bacterium]
MKRAFLLLLACHLCFLFTTTSTFSQETTRRRVVSQQSPQDYSEGESLKIGVEYVQVVFSVVDEQGRPVTDLTGTQVELLEDGRLQQIELFQKSNSLPMVLSILIDISGSQEFLLPDEKTAVDTFLDNFFRDGKDYGAIATFQGETELISGLTSNLKRLKSSLKRIKRQQSFRDEEGEVSNIGTALYDAIITSCREVLDAKTARRITGDDGSPSSTTRRAIRRAMIVLSDGKDTASDGSIRKAIRNAQRLGISVYALGMGDRFRFSDVDREV